MKFDFAWTVQIAIKINFISIRSVYSWLIKIVKMNKKNWKKYFY